jgi:hypothetical protein
MKALLFILLFSFIGSASAAEYLLFKDPYFYFSMYDKILWCHATKSPVTCFSKDDNIIVKYKCKVGTKDEGYLKDCRTNTNTNMLLK